MNTAEKLQAIRAKCLELISGHAEVKHSTALAAIAGWRATITQIDHLLQIGVIDAMSMTRTVAFWKTMESDILAAWEGIV